MDSTHDYHAEAIFQSVISDFKSKLQDDELYAELLKTTSIDQVYDATDKLQEEQSQKGHLRHLSKIGPYLERLRDYTGAIDTFVQVKPDILGLIWGPIKLLLQWTNALKKSFDAVIDTTAQIGTLLPEFKEAAIMFGHNESLHEVLALFFQDIVDFYVIALKFFKMTRWQYFFESMWPRQRDKIGIAITHVERHATLMRGEVQREHIREEHAARLQALQYFEKNEKDQIDSSFNSIKANISPVFYDSKLDRIEGRLCPGTGKWLVRDATFRKWTDPTDVSTRRLWLRGIPGSGKTFLATTAIREAMKHSRTLFVYLSHTLSSTTSALSVAHTTLFQLAQEDQDLRARFCELHSEKVKNSLGTATELLKTLFQCTSLTFIIIDGLDEIDKIERGRLLEQLLDISQACENVRILISSRPEHDITAILERSDPSVSGKSAFESIRIDHRNSGSIQRFINHQKNEWFNEREFLNEHQTAIEVLLAPLASKAKGMFLYAEVVVKTIWNLDLEEIQDELSVPPEDLNDAYSRILGRINKMNNRDANKARNILGWVGCSPFPLTIQEIEQALCVSADISKSAKVTSKLNISKLCGPIVEIADEYVQFVHFTVKEYFFSPQIPGFINLVDAELALAKRCIWYLCQAHHDPLLAEDPEELDTMIISGQFRLHYYAANAWTELVKGWLSRLNQGSLSEELLTALSSLYEQRSRGSSDDLTHDVGGIEYQHMFQLLKSQHPKLCDLLLYTAQFQRRSIPSSYHVQRKKRWTHTDPLTISDISLLIYERLDQLFCNDICHNAVCHCFALNWHYGARPFKCGFLDCQVRRHGFSTKSQRHKHERNHETPWKYDKPSCDYSDIGFLSKKMRDEHWQTHTQQTGSLGQESLQASEDELQPLMFDLVKADDVKVISLLLPRFISQVDSSRYRLITELCKTAASSASVPMTRLLFQARWEPPSFWRINLHDKVELICASIRGSNTDVLRWFASNFRFQASDGGRLRVDPISIWIKTIIECESTEAWEICREQLLSILFSPTTVKRNPPWAKGFARAIILATAGIPDRESFLISLWDQLKGHQEKCHVGTKAFDKEHLGDALNHVASTTCSIPLARRLIEYGAPVDMRRSVKCKTPIHQAISASSLASSELARFLLYQGADPNTGTYGIRMKTGKKIRSEEMVKSIREEKGAVEMKKWLGLSWDDLVHQVKRNLEAGISWPGPDH